MFKKSDDSHEAEGARSRYDDALLSANWNPVIDLLRSVGSERRQPAQRKGTVVSDAEATAFLGRIYAAGA